MSQWIDFKALRQKLDFEKVLRHYGVEIKRKGDQHQGWCPLPTHQGERKKSQSFSANLKKGIFKCFSCNAQGNVLDFAIIKEGLDPENGEHVRKIALELQKQFCPELEVAKKTDRKEAAPVSMEEKQMALPAVEHKKRGEQSQQTVLVNEPLDFELKRLDPSHSYLLDRGFTAETVKRFGLGFCDKGYHAGRVAIPLHDEAAQLIGYAGRIVDNSKIDDEHPRYLFPGTRERNGVTYEFRKTEFLYNGFRVTPLTDDIIVVESFTGVWWLSQMGFSDAVGLMGSSCSETQARLIMDKVSPDGRVWIIPDGDDAGEQCAVSTLKLVSPVRSVRWVKLGSNKQPTDYPGAFFREEMGR